MKTFALCGFMAAGKSTLAKRIAERFKLNPKILISDLDQLIEQESGTNISEIFRLQGEVRFRELEEHALVRWLEERLKNGSYEWAMIALGGGALQSSQVRELLLQKHVVLVWIDTPWELCRHRILQTQVQRPLINLGMENLKSLYEQRKFVYQQSDFILDGAKSETEILESFVQLLCKK